MSYRQFIYVFKLAIASAQSRSIQEVSGSMSELVEIRIPHGGSVENVEINEWLVSVGDVIDEGQPIADVSTDKADTELEAPASGRIVRFLVDVRLCHLQGWRRHRAKPGRRELGVPQEWLLRTRIGEEALRLGRICRLPRGLGGRLPDRHDRRRYG